MGNYMKVPLLFALSSFLFFQSLHAAITITGTRIIYPSSKKIITVQLNNSANTPALAQVWLDDGDANNIPSADKLPFILTPALVQIGPEKGQMIRLLIKNTDYLPKDRESLFWFNVLDIPSSLKNEEQNKLNISIRSRIKLFYRPDKLNMSLVDAYKNLIFNYSQQTNELKIKNHSPYYISFLSIIYNPEKENVIDDSAHMLEPFSELKIKSNNSFKVIEIKYAIIDDFGANRFYTIPVKN